MIRKPARSPWICMLPAAGLALALLAHATGSQAATSIKCWINKQGVHECGTSVPPEYSQEGHEVLNSEGMVIKKEQRAKTPEELKEEAKKAAAEAAEKRKEEEAKRRDQVLLATFANVGDIERVRDEQLKSIDATISVTNARDEKIQKDLDQRIKAAADQERSGKKPTNQLLDQIKSLRGQIARNQKYISDQQQEKDRINQEYAEKIARFKELKGQKP